MTTQFPTQQGLLDELQDDLARYRKIIGHLSDEDQQVPFTSEGWSVKDFLSHMSHWKSATQKLIVAYTHDQPLPPVTPSGDAANAEARAIDKDMSLPQVRTYWEETHEHFIHLITDELDDTRLRDEVRPPWDEDTTEPLCTMIASICGHDAEHMELIEQYFEIPQEK